MLPTHVRWTDDFYSPPDLCSELGPLKLNFQGTWVLSTPEGALGCSHTPFVNYWEQMMTI